MVLKAKDTEGGWKKQTMGILSNLSKDNFVQMNCWHYPNDFTLFIPAHFYHFPPSLSEQFLVQIMN
eukprot:2720261-Prorocentrum_lima.AAC.1